MKPPKFHPFLLVGFLGCLSLAGCGSKDGDNSPPTDGDKKLDGELVESVETDPYNPIFHCNEPLENVQFWAATEYINGFCCSGKRYELIIYNDLYYDLLYDPYSHRGSSSLGSTGRIAMEEWVALKTEIDKVLSRQAVPCAHCGIGAEGDGLQTYLFSYRNGESVFSYSRSDVSCGSDQPDMREPMQTLDQLAAIIEAWIEAKIYPEDGDQGETPLTDGDLDLDSDLAGDSGDTDSDYDLDLSNSICEELLSNPPREGASCQYTRWGPGSVAACWPKGACYIETLLTCESGFWTYGSMTDIGCSALSSEYQVCCGCEPADPPCGDNW